MATAVLASTALFLVGSTSARADTELQPYLEHALGWIRNRDHNPAIAALIQIDGTVAAEAVIGDRALGHPESVTLQASSLRRCNISLLKSWLHHRRRHSRGTYR